MKEQVNVRVAALILVDGKILSMKYRYGEADVYNLPGGNLEFGEEMKTALARELTEELGVAAKINDDVLVAEVILNGKHTVHQVFDAEILAGIPTLNPQETKALEVHLLPIDQLGEVNLYPAVGGYIKQYLSGKLADKYVGKVEQGWF